ncbi:hypothetical protein KAFR_0A00500 [Kazachstania africana CBS 2517]|uniref:Kinetochore protein Spc24 n=1 Tax=Kazachstania africana (strain ATCC 22294 / BCRC 22015 / CBS 2517 / CECT 1963 / NBRC 1671 / NRRL Y-8276) TaxID=1071382 RepID=H2AM88_KAZAF|nr:hypothetical protein KAFR_0A00500 [Kazachstania africana CBS 2517]CCF55488.1 hypothetical protein KAFR_0A00500 [Kazachstania africana CBS 2517]
MSSEGKLIDDPASLLKETREAFNIEEDIENLIEINKKLKQIKEKSNTLIKNRNLNIKKLSNDMNAHKDKTDTLTIELQRIREENFKIKENEANLEIFVNDLNKLESETTELRQNIDDKVTKLISEPNTLDFTADPSILDDPVAKANLLKLKFYRSMGIIIDSDNNQVLIENAKNKIDILPLDDDYSDFFKTKFIWDRIKKSQSREETLTPP